MAKGNFLKLLLACLSYLAVGQYGFADSNLEKQVTLKSRFWELAPAGNALSAPSISFPLGQEAMIHMEGPKYSGSGLKEGFRLKVKASESRNGLLLEGYALTGIYDPTEAELQARIFGLFDEEKSGQNEAVQPEWAKELEVSGCFRVRGQAYVALSTPHGDFWLKEGQSSSGYKLIEADLSDSEVSVLVEKDGQRAWLGLRARGATEPLDLVHFLDKGELIFIKEIIESDSTITIPYEGENGEKMMFEMQILPN